MHYCSSICQILFLRLCEMHDVLWLPVFFFLLFSCQFCPGFQNYKSLSLILKSLNMVVRRVEVLRFLRKNWCKNWHYHFHATYDHQIWLACNPGELTQMRLIKLVLVRSSRQDHMTNKNFIFTTRVPMTITLEKMVTDLNGLLSIKSQDPLMMRSCAIMWQNKTVPQCL